MKRLARLVAMGIASLMVLVGAVSPASAQEIDPAVQAELRAVMSRHGMPVEVQDLLVSKLERGEPWDSGRSEVPPERIETINLSGAIQTTKIWPDGSRIITTVSQPESSLTNSNSATRSVSECKKSGYGGYYVLYSNCKVMQDSLLMMMGFYFSYTVPNGAVSSITDYGREFNRCVLCKISNGGLKKLSSTSVRYSADIWTGVDFSWTGISLSAGSTSRHYVQVVVEGSTANMIVA